MARLLVEKETIFSEEVDLLMQGKSVEEIIAFMEENESKLSENPFERKNRVIVPEKKVEKKEDTIEVEVIEEKPKTPRKRTTKTVKKEDAPKTEDKE